MLQRERNGRTKPWVLYVAGRRCQGARPAHGHALCGSHLPLCPMAFMSKCSCCPGEGSSAIAGSPGRSPTTWPPRLKRISAPACPGGGRAPPSHRDFGNVLLVQEGDARNVGMSATGPVGAGSCRTACEFCRETPALRPLRWLRISGNRRPHGAGPESANQRQGFPYRRPRAARVFGTLIPGLRGTSTRPSMPPYW